MIKGKGFELILSSDEQYEELCGEIYFDGEFVAIITQEEGLEKPKIEISSPQHKPTWEFNFLELIDFLKKTYENI